MTLDEWTSKNSKRFFNISLFTTSAQFNLGLCRIRKKFDFSNAINSIKIKLAEFNLDINQDIVGITTDGAALMKKIGRLLLCEHQICINHGIHLAVMDSLYLSKSIRGNVLENHVQDSLSDESSDCFDDEMFFEQENGNDNEVAFDEYWEQLISKTRKTIKVFKYSPAKTEILENLKAASCRPKLPGKLIMDVKTRWNSLEEMINMFLKNFEWIEQALRSLKEKINFSSKEIVDLTELQKSLSPVKILVHHLSANHTSISSADSAVKHTIKELLTLNHPLCIKMAKHIESRYKERENIGLLRCVNYLRDPKTISFEKDDVKECIIEKLKTIYKRFFYLKVLVKLQMSQQVTWGRIIRMKHMSFTLINSLNHCEML